MRHRFLPPLQVIILLAFVGETWTLGPLVGVAEERRGDWVAEPSDTAVIGETSGNPLAVKANPCVLLRNDNLLFGEARQVGTQVIVKTSEGSEVKINHEEVLCWAESPQHLYQYRVDHRQANDVAAMIRDARWCIRYDLFDLAGRELLAIRRLAPNHTEADAVERQLFSQWEQHNAVLSRSRSNLADTSSDHGGSSQVSTNESLAGYVDKDDQKEEQVNRRAASEDPVSLKQFARAETSSTAIRYFASNIQPMLVNRCGVCHANSALGAESTGWQLVVPPVGSRASSMMTHENLESVIRFVDHRLATETRLYRMATEAHGGREAGLTSRNGLAIESLVRWITTLISDHAGDRDSKIAAANHLGQADDTSKTAGNSLTSIAQSATHPLFPSNRALPARLPLVHNPFDPQLFNRRLNLKTSPDDTTSAER